MDSQSPDGPGHPSGSGLIPFLGLVADISAIVSLAVNGVSALAVVLALAGLVTGVVTILTRFKGATAVGGTVAVIALGVGTFMIIGPDRVHAMVAPPPAQPSTAPPTTLAPPTTPQRRITGMAGGCEPFRIVAQNRWNPTGAKILPAPTYSAETEKIGSLGPNEAAYVDGWVRGNVAYPTNPPPWNSDVYFHLHDGRGWVTFAGIRTLPTTFDPTGLDPDGGPEVPLYAECEGVSR